MKNMKKLLAALMMAVMVLVLAAPAVLAEDAQTETTEQSAPEVQAPAKEPARETEAPAKEAQPEATAEPEATVEAQPEATAEPEATVEAQPETTPAPEATVEAQPEATAEANATQNTERSIKVVSNSSNLQVGETLTLTAKLSGFDGIEYQLNWQVKTEGGDWQNVSGEHGETLKVKLDDQSIGSSWRVVVETAD